MTTRPCRGAKTSASERRFRRLAALFAIMSASALAAACSPTATSAQGTKPEGSGLHGIAEAVGAATTVPEAADFVRNSRKGKADYMAVGVTPPDRSVKPLDAKGVEKLQRELDATRSHHDALAGRKPAPAGKAGAKDGKAKKKLLPEKGQSQ